MMKTTFASNDKRYHLDLAGYSKTFNNFNEGFNLILYFIKNERDGVGSILAIVRNLKINNRHKNKENRESIDSEHNKIDKYKVELNNLLNENKFQEKVKTFIISSVKIRSKLLTLLKSYVGGLNTTKRKDQVKQLESDCQEVKRFLDKYFTQIQYFTTILELILSNINEDRIV